MNILDHPLLMQPPARVEPPYSWVGHIPFAMLLVDLIRPRVLVELGTHSGNSYNAFCQAVDCIGLSTQCYAVDTWTGDPQAGHYGPEIFKRLQSYQQDQYPGFSTMMRMTFDEAAAQFDPGSIDLLHIDGLHTYDAVRHDFETWLPKMTEHGVILFHDTNVHHGDFGVWRLWQELSARYPALEFKHSHGLGVLAVGPHAPEPLHKLLTQDTASRAHFVSLIERIGNGLLQTYQAPALEHEIQRLKDEMAALIHDSQEVIGRHEVNIQALDGMAHRLQEQHNNTLKMLDEILNSTSWRVTSPLRKLSALMHKLSKRRSRADSTTP